MSPHQVNVSLRIRHPSIEPGEISTLIGLDPQHSWKAGQVRRGPGGETLEGRYRETYWMTTLSATPQSSRERVSIDGALRQALSKLRQASHAICQLNERGVTADLHVSIQADEHFSLDLPAEVLALLGRMGLGVSLEVHSEDEHV